MEEMKVITLQGLAFSGVTEHGAIITILAGKGSVADIVDVCDTGKEKVYTLCIYDCFYCSTTGSSFENILAGRSSDNEAQPRPSVNYS